MHGKEEKLAKKNNDMTSKTLQQTIMLTMIRTSTSTTLFSQIEVSENYIWWWERNLARVVAKLLFYYRDRNLVMPKFFIGIVNLARY